MLVTIRRMECEDAAQVFEIERQSFSEPWPLIEFEKASSNDNYRYIVAEYDGRIVGYAGCTVVCDEADIMNIAVIEEYKRMGIGAKLIEILADEAAKKGAVTMYLEVRVSNTAARNLYSQNGFTEIGLRPGFYRLPDEDAVLMSKTLI